MSDSPLSSRSPKSTSTTDPVIVAEQSHLVESRQAMQQMKEYTENLFNSTFEGGNRLSTEVLKSVLWHRAQALAADPAIPLFFGRLDYGAGANPEADEIVDHPFYIGRRHITAHIGGEPLVVDWRAPISLPFYQAHASDPMGVELRRRFGFDQGRLTAYEDEHLSDHQGSASSKILQAEIERPRSGPMRDIVATIQPEQDVLVRADLRQSICIQGAPGTGKTAVGLHRAAYLLYTFADQLRRSKVAIVGPNASFMSYISDVLPALGEIDIESHTVPSLLSADLGVTATGSDPVATATLKGDVRMAEVIRRAVWDRITAPAEPLVISRGARHYRIAPYLVVEDLDYLRGRDIRYLAGTEMLAIRLAHRVLLRMEAAGVSTDDRVQNSVARSAQMRSYVNQIWPKLTAVKIIFDLLSSPTELASFGTEIFTRAEQEALQWSKPARSVKSVRWSEADLALVDEANAQLSRPAGFGHIIIDEAQDLSAMQLRALGRRSDFGSITLMGDLAQATTPWAGNSWTTALDQLGHPDAEIDELVAGFRVPAEVINFAARLLPSIAPGLRPPYSVRESAGQLIDLATSEQHERLRSEVRRLLTENEGTIGIITAASDLDQVRSVLSEFTVRDLDLINTETPTGAEGTWGNSRVELVSANRVKGLEFDHVIIVEPADLVEQEIDRVIGLRTLYVALTRAVMSLTLIRAKPLPIELDTQADAISR